MSDVRCAICKQRLSLIVGKRNDMVLPPHKRFVTYTKQEKCPGSGTKDYAPLIEPDSIDIPCAPEGL